MPGKTTRCLEKRNSSNKSRDIITGEGTTKQKKTRRSKPIQNQLKSFRVYYINMRDLKSKRSSFEEIIAELKPTVVAVTETWMDDSNSLELEGYATPFKNNRNVEGGGVLLAVRKELEHVTTEVKRTKEAMESLWIVINNTKIRIRIGVVYFPQEQDQNLKEIYSIIKEQLDEAGKKGESFLLLGDFNCKVGEIVKGNYKKISTGGKKLIKLVEKEGLELVNSMDICEGIWTKDENNNRSVLDYGSG